MNKKLSIILAGFLIVNPVIPVFAEELSEKSSIVESSDATDTSTSREEKVQSTTESASNNEEEVNLDSVELDASVENDPADGIEVEQAVEFDQQQNDTSITIPTPYADNITGKWGTVPWTYNTVTGELVFTGSGTLGTGPYAPWRGLNSPVPYSSITKIIFQKKVTVLDGYSLFAYNSNKATNLTSIEGLENLDTSEATDMSEMFSGLVSVTALDVSSLDTSNVTEFSSMFSDCKSLNNLDLSNFNTSKAKSFDFMFFSCPSLTNLNVTSFNTSNATSMMGMFGYCSSLPTIDLSNFNTSNVTNFEAMFKNCESLETIELNSFNTSKVTQMHAMFEECNSLKTLDLSSFDTTNVLQKNYMLYMSSLRSVTLGEKTIIKGTDVQDIDTSDGIYTGRWIKEPDASVIYESSDKFMYDYDGSSPGTYTWEKSEESLVIDFDSNGGSSIPSQLIVANETLTKPTDPTKEGYTFAGWYTDEALTQPFDFDTPITQVTTLYAKWTETGLPIGNYPVYFNSNGGSSIPSQLIVANETLTKPTDPTKEGYTFAGWYVDEALTQLFDFDKPITQTTTLYAKWTETGLPIGNYPVYFNSNGGSSIPSQLIVANETLTKPTDPTKEGYTFAGWYTDEALTQPFDFDTPITQVTTLYAKWTKIDTSQKNQSSLSKEKNASISNNSSTGKQLPSTGETNSFIIISWGLLLFFVTSRFILRRNKLN